MQISKFIKESEILKKRWEDELESHYNFPQFLLIC